MFCLFCVAILCFAPMVVFNPQNYLMNLSDFLNAEKSSTVVLVVHHVETFEGGSASRAKFLESVAKNFSKQNKNCFVVTKTLSAQQLVLNMRENNIPDLYSFGMGVGNLIAGFLEDLGKNKNCREDLQNWGVLAEKSLAQPYILSGYAVCSHQNMLQNAGGDWQKAIDGVEKNKKKIAGLATSAGSTNAIVALEATGAKLFAPPQMFEKSYDAYVNFVENKSVSLLGTLRDVHRLKNREQLGTIDACQFQFVSGYTDLAQFVGVVEKNESLKSAYAHKFVDFLLSSSSQQMLSNFGLCSVLNEKIYFEGYMQEAEQALSTKLAQVNAFWSAEQIANMREESLQRLMLKSA